MALSSNTLIHFTSEKDALKGILAENFKIKYCCEKIQLNTIEHFLHIPMISFCDIPLSQIKNHIASYGHYGVGLSRNWALENRLNPVLYIQEKSTLADNYEKLLRHMHEKKNNGTSDETARRMAKEIIQYMKNYEGSLERSGNIIKNNYRYSDEREWRYVPENSNSYESIYSRKDFNIKGKVAANNEISSLRLKFNPDDIKYIIIKSDE